MSQTASLVLLAFVVKVAAVICAAQLLRRSFASFLESLLAAWLLIQLTLFASMLVLSLFHGVSAPALWSMHVVLAVVVASRVGRPAIHRHDWSALASQEAVLAWVGIAGTVGFLAYRSFFFFDNTWDGLSYELPRIAFWAKHQTLFMHQPTQAMNIFSNEWNGELNALMYVVMSGSDAGAAFGNVEVWLLTCLSLAWFAGIMGAPTRTILACGLALAATPLLLGQAMTVKGDLLSVACLVMAVGFVLALMRRPQPAAPVHWRFVLALGAAGMASGAKITILPATATLAGLWAIRCLARRPFRAGLKELVLGAIALMVGNARYFVNLIQFGHPVLRVDGETRLADVGFSTMMENVNGITRSYLEALQPRFDAPLFWVLSGGLGYLGIAVLAWVLVGLIARIASRPAVFSVSPPRPIAWRSSSDRSLAWILAATLGGGLAVLLLAIPWQPWSLRYFGSWLMICLASILAWPFRHLSRRLATTAILLWTLPVMANLWSSFGRYGDGLAGPFHEALERTQLQRKTAFHPYFSAGEHGLERIDFEGRGPLRIVVLNQLDSAIYPFFGDNHENHVELVDRVETLMNRVSGSQYDLVVFTGPRLTESRQAARWLSGQGYRLEIDWTFWRVFSRS